MLENFKRVSNPLTIIAIFAGLAEIAGTVALKLVDPTLQAVFVWFVMGFPVLLVLLFFITLNFNPTVLYAPSDFRDDESFLNILERKQKISVDLADIKAELEEAKRKIIREAEQKVGATGEKEKKGIATAVAQELGRIGAKVESAQESAEQLAMDLSVGRVPRSNLQVQLLGRIAESPEPLSLEVLAESIGWRPHAIERAVSRMVDRGLIQVELINSKIHYRLPK